MRGSFAVTVKKWYDAKELQIRIHRLVEAKVSHPQLGMVTSNFYLSTLRLQHNWLPEDNQKKSNKQMMKQENSLNFYSIQEFVKFQKCCSESLRVKNN